MKYRIYQCNELVIKHGISSARMPLQYICTFSRRISGSLDKMEEAGRNREEEEVCVLRELPWKRQLKGR